GNDGPPQMFMVTPGTRIRYSGKPAGEEVLHGRAVVTGHTVTGNTLSTLDLSPVQRKVSTSLARQFLLGAMIVEFAAILLIITNAAASTVTREKEDGSLDLLLSTPITSRYYIWGKLRGLVAFVVPLIAVPVASALIFVLYDVWRMMTSEESGFEWIVLPESVILLPGMLVIVSAFAAILGMQMSLRLRRTVSAVMGSVGIIVGLCGLLGWCGFMMLTESNEEITMLFAAFSPFTLLTVLVDPAQFADNIW